jgi:chemotaxis protein CheZ
MSAAADDLEALFDQVAAESARARAAAAARPAAPAKPEVPVEAAHAEAESDVFHRVGMLTRTLHDSLRELGYDKVVENAVTSLPDARDRLDYIAALTGQAAERALAAAEAGQTEQGRLAAGATRLAANWDRAFDGALSLDEFKSTAVATRAFLRDVPAATGATNAQFTEIMLAQDFHDLSGQVIQRIVKLARELEDQLVKLLIATTPPEKRPATEQGWLTGPAMNAAQRSDVVAGQAQVDELLESLGF